MITAFAERKLPFISFYSFISVSFVSFAFCMFHPHTGCARSAAGQVQHTSVDRRHASAVDEPAVNVIAENGTVGARFCITENTRICPPRVCPPCSSRIGKKHPALHRVPSPFRRSLRHSLPSVTARQPSGFRSLFALRRSGIPALRRVPSPFRRSLPFVTARHAVRISLILRPAPIRDPRFSPPHPRELRE